MDLPQLLTDVQGELRQLRAEGAERERAELRHRGGSRFAGEGATDEALEALAAMAPGGGVKAPGVGRVAEPPQLRGTTGGAKLADVMTKALAEGTGSAGGYLVQSEVAAEVMKSLRARSAVMRLGPTVVPVKKDLAVTSISSGATAFYVSENARIPTSEQVFAQTPLLVPKELAALVPVSNRLLLDAERPGRGARAARRPGVPARNRYRRGAARDSQPARPYTGTRPRRQRTRADL